MGAYFWEVVELSNCVELVRSSFVVDESPGSFGEFSEVDFWVEVSSEVVAWEPAFTSRISIVWSSSKSLVASLQYAFTTPGSKPMSRIAFIPVFVQSSFFVHSWFVYQGGFSQTLSGCSCIVVSRYDDLVSMHACNTDMLMND